MQVTFVATLANYTVASFNQSAIFAYLQNIQARHLPLLASSLCSFSDITAAGSPC